MMHKKLLVTGTLSTLLLASSLSAQGNCVNGVCFVNLENLKPKKVVHKKSEPKTHTISVTSNAYDVVEDGEVTVVFSSYVMTPEEKAAYEREQKAIALNKKANEEAYRELRIVSQPVEKVEDKILNRNLPTSDYFCDNDKKPVHIENSDLYECV